MSFEKHLPAVQKSLEKHHLDGWLLYGFHNLNSICTDLLNLPSHIHQTRKFLYFIPKVGMPSKVVHAIEKHLYSQVPGKEIVYKSFQEWENILSALLKGLSTLACDYSPMGEIPTISKIDAGTFEKIRSFGVKIHSSGELISEVFATLSEPEIALHKKAAKKLEAIYDEIPHFITAQSKKEDLYEKDLQDFIVSKMKDLDLQSEDLPICAVGENTSYPHYQIQGKGKKLEKGLLLLVDMWGRERGEQTIFADMTHMFFLGSKKDPKAERLFELTLAGQQLAIDTIEEHLKKGQVLHGAHIDEVVRAFFEREGMGSYIFHRLGHSIEKKLHGRGPNLDSLETKDLRPIQKGMLFSIEPGLYIPGEIGVRLELDALLRDQLEITTGRQKTLPTIVIP